MFLENSNCLIYPLFCISFLLLPWGTFTYILSIIRTTVTFRGLILVAFFCCFCFETTHLSNETLGCFRFAPAPDDDEGNKDPKTGASASDGFPSLEQSALLVEVALPTYIIDGHMWFTSVDSLTFSGEDPDYYNNIPDCCQRIHQCVIILLNKILC